MNRRKRVLDPKRCRAIIYHGPIVSYQCKRKSRYGGFCGTHDPKAKEARHNARLARWASERAARSKVWAAAELTNRRGEHFPAMLKAMEDALDALNDRCPMKARDVLMHAIGMAGTFSGTNDDD